MESRLIRGVIYSQFDQKAGPLAIVWVPTNINYDTRNLVSMKTIQMLAGEEGKVPKSLAVLPFPSIDSKGLVKFLEIKAPGRRGSTIDSSLTLLFNEADDLIFYKYIQDFEAVFEEVSKKIKKLDEKKAGKKKITEVIIKFQEEMMNLLGEFRETETSSKEPEAFPVETEEDAKVRHRKYKLIVCGDPHVGKTSTVLRFTDNAFKRTYIPTIGVNLSDKKVRYKDLDIKFVLWDIAGQTKFQKMRNYFYRGADGIVLIFDLTDPESFENIPKWYQDIKTHLKSKLPGIVLGNKNDLVDQRQIQTDKGATVAQKLNLDYFETSALTGENIDASFSKMAEKLYKPKKDQVVKAVKKKATKKKTTKKRTTKKKTTKKKTTKKRTTKKKSAKKTTKRKAKSPKKRSGTKKSKKTTKRKHKASKEATT